MPRRTSSSSRQTIPDDVTKMLCDESLPLEARYAMLSEFRQNQPELATHVDRYLLGRMSAQSEGLRRAERSFKEMENVLAKLTEPPLHPAIYVASAETGAVPTAMIAHGNAWRVIPIADDLDPESLAVGDAVLLNQDLSAVIRKSPMVVCFGEVAAFDHFTEDGRMLVRRGEQEEVIGLADGVPREDWQPGDLVRWDRTARLGFERIRRAEGQEFRVEQVEDIDADRVGGRARQTLDQLVSALMLMMSQKKVARKYGLLDGKQLGILMIGPPGCGKTLMARVSAAQVQRNLGRRCNICVVKPGQFEDPYVGVTQRRIRECFKALRDAGEFGLLFLDEVESIARVRGGSMSQHGDKFLAALLAEMQGFATDGDSGIVVIAATNRVDLIDPALVERLEMQFEIRRPDMRSARQILPIHLQEQFPYHPNGDQAARTRLDLIELVVSRLYAPNADNDLCTIRFRDNTQRVVNCREVVSGRILEQVCREARRRAAFREVAGGVEGVCLDDVEHALADTLDKLRGQLALHNVRQYLADLPQDMDIVAVEPVQRRVTRRHQYVNGV